MVNFKCTIKSKHAKAHETPYRENLKLFEDEDTVFLEGFRAMVKNTHKFPGYATIHRSKRNGSHLLPGAEIVDFEFSLEENETIFVLYDEKINVTPGGYGSGAETDPGNTNKKAVAEGGTGTGGRVDGSGKSKAGSGFGGHLFSETGGGTGGTGIGGTVEGESGKAGIGVGGNVNKMLHPSLLHKKEEQGKSKSVSSTHEHRGNR